MIVRKNVFYNDNDDQDDDKDDGGDVEPLQGCQKVLK